MANSMCWRTYLNSYVFVQFYTSYCCIISQYSKIYHYNIVTRFEYNLEIVHLRVENNSKNKSRPLLKFKHFLLLISNDKITFLLFFQLCFGCCGYTSLLVLHYRLNRFYKKISDNFTFDQFLSGGYAIFSDFYLIKNSYKHSISRRPISNCIKPLLQKQVFFFFRFGTTH